MNGYTREELIGQSIDIFNIAPDTHEEHKVYLEQMRSEGVVRLEATHRHKDGHIFPIEVSTSIFTFEGRELVLGIDRDISERKQTEVEIKRRMAELETLYENGLLISGLLDPKKIAQRIVEVLEQNLDWHHIAIRQYHPESNRLELLAFSQPDLDKAQLEHHAERINRLVSTPDHGLSGWVIRHGRPARSGNLPEDPRYLETYPGLKSGVYVPFLAGDATIGSIAVESETADAFKEEDERLLITLANQAAISFENAKLYARLQKELDERRQVEDQIRKLNIELEQRVAIRTAEIETAHQRMELAASAAGIGIWELETETDSLFWDERMHELYGTSPVLFNPTVTDWINFVHPDDRQRMKEARMNVIEQGGPYENEFRIVTEDGTLRHISSHGVVLFDEKNNYTGMIGINLDITTIKQAEETLRMANLELERALKVKDEFLANMSHELRTPLNAILGLSESLEEQIAGPLNEKQQKYVHTIGESGHHLLTLINDILDLAKIEAGQIILDINKVNVHLVCQASIRMVKQLAQKKEQNVNIEIDEKVNLIWADERRLKQMIVNLLSNAVKFTPQGGKLGIKVDADQSDNTVMITVWDTGIGIKDEDMDRLFQPFVQLNGSLDRESPGTGLGLALVAQMTRLHGGRITVNSSPDDGSRFTIILPWKPAIYTGSLSKHQTGDLKDITSPTAETSQIILLVEDTDAVVMMLKDYLESAGYHIIVARDGLEGIMQAKRFHPDLILMDVMMPGMDGLEATRRIRNEPDLENIPIIGLTALAMPSDRERCLAAGMNGYMSKPVMLNELVLALQNHLPSQEEA
jgi:PAS domain S-box-containing protein